MTTQMTMTTMTNELPPEQIRTMTNFLPPVLPISAEFARYRERGNARADEIFGCLWVTICASPFRPVTIAKQTLTESGSAILWFKGKGYTWIPKLRSWTVEIDLGPLHPDLRENRWRVIESVASFMDLSTLDAAPDHICNVWENVWDGSIRNAAYAGISMSRCAKSIEFRPGLGDTPFDAVASSAVWVAAQNKLTSKIKKGFTLEDEKCNELSTKVRNLAFDWMRVFGITAVHRLSAGVVHAKATAWIESRITPLPPPSTRRMRGLEFL